LKDPYGHLWFLATRKEDLTQEQIEQRAREMFQQG
jgi:PhnB protein